MHNSASDVTGLAGLRRGYNSRASNYKTKRWDFKAYREITWAYKFQSDTLFKQQTAPCPSS